MVLFQHIVIPIASEQDAQTTCVALDPYLDHVERVTAVHVIEKAGGAPDKAPLEKRQSDAERFLRNIDYTLSDRVEVETETVYGTDVVAALFDAAEAIEGDAIAFRPRGGSRIKRLLSGDVASRLVVDPPVPVMALPANNS